MYLSPHFTLREFLKSQAAARRGIDNIPTELAVANMRELCQFVLEPIRAKFGTVVISSGFRSPRLNKAIGGAPTSQHMTGEAADIEVPGVPNDVIARWIVAKLDFDQVIREFSVPGDPMSGWVHVSYRNRAMNRHSILTARRVDGRTVYIPGIVTN